LLYKDNHFPAIALEHSYSGKSNRSFLHREIGNVLIVDELYSPQWQCLEKSLQVKTKDYWI